MSEKKQFQATSLRKALVFIMVVVLFAAIGGFYLGLQQIRTLAVDVSHATEDATASGAQVQQLQVLQGQLAQAQTLVDKADKIFITEAAYQSQAVKDLQKYAATAGISISNTDFTQPESNAGQPGRIVTIQLSQPVSFSKLTYFIQLVEGSIPKMEISSLTVSRPAAPSGDEVNVESIGIRISVQ